MIRVIDDVLADPLAYRTNALAQPFEDVTIGRDTFRGIARCSQGDVAAVASGALPGTKTILTFFRKSPEGQVEPNFVHSDEMMGDFTGIYYMNPEPKKGDGTAFWEQYGVGWRKTQHIEAKFNRLLLFSADLHHSRAIFENYGDGDDARLIQVVFLR